MDIILASQSPRRRELLHQMGLKGFKVTSPDVDEDVDENLHPSLMVEELSLRKAKAVAAHADEDDIIIAADTVVALEGTALGKPMDEADAFTMLSALSGNRHYVYTGFTVMEDADGAGFTSYSDIAPLTTRHLYCLIEVPKSVMENEVTLTLFFHGQEYSYTAKA